MEAAFWAACSLVVIGYALLPVWLAIRATLRPKPYRRSGATPSVSILIAAHDEEAVIAGKLESVLACDYPADRVEVIVASDGSRDATVEVAGRFAARGVRVLDLPRVGKAAALNRAAAAARGDILAFSDANSRFVAWTLRALVAPFADPTVGGVAGDQRYAPGGSDDAVADGERSYWAFDRWLKIMGSRSGSATSATGALYAVRRDLFLPVIDGVTDDFYVSTGVIAQGARLVFAPDAAVYEPVAPSAGLEYARKVRVMTRGLRGVLARRELLDPRRTGGYAVQLFAHKLARRLVALPLLALAVLIPLLSGRHPAFGWLTIGELVFLSTAAVGLTRGRLGTGPVARLATLPAYFVLVNGAALHAIANVVRGVRIDRWDPDRGAAAPAGGT